MNVTDFFDEDDIESAPDDPPDAFAYLVEKAQRRLSDFCRELPDDNDSWRDVHEARYSFMNVVTALAKAYGINEFSSLMPDRKSFQSEDYDQFRHDLDHYITQLIVIRSKRRRIDSIIIFPKIKESIRTHLHHIKTHIDAAEISESKRAALHRKLAEFEAALEKASLNVVAVARFVIEVMSLSANGLTVADSATLHRLCGTVLKTVAAEKAQQEQTRAIEGPPVRLIEASMPVRRGDKGTQLNMASTKKVAFDLDDEIPF